MANKPRLLVENLFSTIQYPNHTLVADEEAAGFEVARLANGRRSSLDYWTPTTANDPATVTATCDRVRAADMFALDRGHNLAGKTITLSISQDNFTTSETVFSLAVPSASTPGPLSNGLGIVTEEGVFVIQFGLRAAKYWRLTIAAMGAGLTPQVVGAHLGLSRELPWPRNPLEDEMHDRVEAVLETDGGWLSSGTGTDRQSGAINFHLETLTDYAIYRPHLQLFYAGFSTWLTNNQNQGDRTLCVRRAPGKQGQRIDRQNPYRGGPLRWVEYAPKRVN